MCSIYTPSPSHASLKLCNVTKSPALSIPPAPPSPIFVLPPSPPHFQDTPQIDSQSTLKPSPTSHSSPTPPPLPHRSASTVPPRTAPSPLPSTCRWQHSTPARRGP